MNSREVHRLTGRIAALNRFISRLTDKCLLFYDLLRSNKKFIWDEPSSSKKIGGANADILHQAVYDRCKNTVVELSEYDVTFQNRPAAKSQVLPDFQIDLTPELDQDLTLPSDNWILQVGGSSSVKGSGIGIHLQSPTGDLLQQSFQLGFKASNNEAEYESLISGLCLAPYTNTRGENVLADPLAALGSSPGDQVRRTIPVQHIDKPSIALYDKANEHIVVIDAIDAMDTSEPIDQPDAMPPDWRIPFIQYLSNGLLPKDKWEALKSLGFYWPTMVADFESYIRKCNKCQRHAPNIHCPTKLLQTTTAPYPFMRWAMDLPGPMPSLRQRKYVLIVTDYVTNNGQSEATNKTILDGIKKGLDLKKGHWAAYGVEAMALAEVNVTSLRRAKMPHHTELNREILLDALDTIEE
ncbi:hypothetical protein N665_0315s0003 [Sinapis alba]|nr:hypothetical protein N665_0315s0003 [Sinapis alba]